MKERGKMEGKKEVRRNKWGSVRMKMLDQEGMKGDETKDKLALKLMAK